MIPGLTFRQMMLDVTGNGRDIDLSVGLYFQGSLQV